MLETLPLIYCLTTSTLGHCKSMCILSKIVIIIIVLLVLGFGGGFLSVSFAHILSV